MSIRRPLGKRLAIEDDTFFPRPGPLAGPPASPPTTNGWSRVNRPLTIFAATSLTMILSASHYGCAPPKAASTAKAVAPAKVEKLPGESDLTTVTLTPEAEDRLKLKTAPVEARDVVRVRTVGGEVVVPPGRTILVSSPFAGTLYAPRAGLPTPGTKVSQGQVIFNLVPLISADSRATFATTRVDAQGMVEQAEKQLAQARITLDRAESLQREKLGGKGAVEDAHSSYAIAESALKSATAKRDAIDQMIKGVEGGAVDPVPIAAEGGGLLRNLLVAPGQKVASGAILFDVVNLDPVHVRVPLYVGELGKIDDARPALVGDLADTSDSPKRQARRVADPPAGDPLAATVDLFFEVENKDAMLRPGQRVGITLPLKGTRNGLAVPLASLLRDVDGGTWVYESLGKHKYSRRRVRVEAVIGDVVSLSAGPKPGTLVVTDGAAEVFGSEFGGAK
jgi:membrane fusion protein, heavy metal efflux system